MSERKYQKLNHLLEHLDNFGLVSSRWLRSHGYSSSLVARYIASGWLVSPARGVYGRRGSKLFWERVVHSLQQVEGLALHVGGRFALAWRGHEHYLRLAEAAIVTLYGPSRLPNWTNRLGVHERFEACGRGPFDFSPPSFTEDLNADALFGQGLEVVHTGSPDYPMVFALPERAMLELCDQPPSASLVYEADAVMQGLSGMRPALVGQLLVACRSIKAKRLFLALADRHNHAWRQKLELGSVDFGKGKRALVPSGRLNTVYHITLPTDLDDHLG